MEEQGQKVTFHDLLDNEALMKTLRRVSQGGVFQQRGLTIKALQPLLRSGLIGAARGFHDKRARAWVEEMAPTTAGQDLLVFVNSPPLNRSQ